MDALGATLDQASAVGGQGMVLYPVRHLNLSSQRNEKNIKKDQEAPTGATAQLRQAVHPGINKLVTRPTPFPCSSASPNSNGASR